MPVALAAGIRRALIGETIYTIKLRHRGHRIPKERHINLFLVKQAKDIMEPHFIIAKAGTSLKDVLGAEGAEDTHAIVVERDGRIVGLVPPRSGLWRASRNDPNVTIDRFMESRLVICREVDLLSRVFARLKRLRSGAAIVFHGVDRPRIADVTGIITKRAIADTVIESYDD
jgi:CIC family chloride channel protein